MAIDFALSFEHTALEQPEPDEVEKADPTRKAGDPRHVIRIDGPIVLDEQAQNAIDEFIVSEAYHAQQRALVPSHVVNVKPQYETVVNRTYDPAVGGGKAKGTDEQGPYWELAEKRQVNVPLHCPDCRRELIADKRGFLVCPQAESKPDALAMSRDDVLACGLER